MKKFVLSYFGLTGLSLLGHSGFKNHQIWNVGKEIVQQELKGKFSFKNFFKGKIIVKKNLSGVDLSGQDFTDCKFVKVDLRGCDLTNTIFNDTCFDNCDLIGAYFRYSVLNSEGVYLDKVFKITTNDFYELIKQYSDLMDEKENSYFDEEVVDLEKQTEALNHLFKALNVCYLEEDTNLIDLEFFNLTGINFKLSNLNGVYLGKVQLFEDFVVPDYQHVSDLFEKFKKAINNNTSKKRGYMKLFQMGLKIINSISNDRLREVQWKGLDLNGSDLSGADLRDTNLIDVQFGNTSLFNTNLRRAWLAEDFQLNYNDPSDLFEKWLASNINNTSDKKYYNMLVANHFDIFKNVSRDRFQLAIDHKLSLNGANLYGIDWTNVDLSVLRLKDIMMRNCCFRNNVIKKIDFKSSNFLGVLFNRCVMQEVKFDLSYCSGINFIGTTLKSVSFRGGKLCSIVFEDVILEDVDFCGADIGWMILCDTELPKNLSDEGYVAFYHSCTDLKAKALLKIILESRGNSLD